MPTLLSSLCRVLIRFRFKEDLSPLLSSSPPSLLSSSSPLLRLLSYAPKTLRPLSYAQSYGFSSLSTARKLLQFQGSTVLES
ncbi:hypothetical protein ACLB2K_077467 [Fragaria x ananassa]